MIEARDVKLDDRAIDINFQHKVTEIPVTLFPQDKLFWLLVNHERLMMNPALLKENRFKRQMWLHGFRCGYQRAMND